MNLRGRIAVVASLAAVLATSAVAVGQAQPQGTAARIPMAEFKRLHQQDAIVVLDVRDAESYAEGHIPGALSLPEDNVPQQLAKLKALKKPIVTYCA